VARTFIERYGPQANPDNMITLRWDKTLSIVEVARRSNSIALTVNAVAVDLIRLGVLPALDVTARFGLVTLARREEAPALGILRAATVVDQWFPSARRSARRRSPRPLLPASAHGASLVRSCYGQGLPGLRPP
jgi:hypothetical protein